MFENSYPLLTLPLEDLAECRDEVKSLKAPPPDDDLPQRIEELQQRTNEAK